MTPKMRWNLSMNRRLTFALIACALIPAFTQGQDPKKADPKAVEKKDAPLDLAALVSNPVTEFRSGARHFEAYRVALLRKYSMPTSPEDYSRLRKYYGDWLKAIDGLPSSGLNADAIEEQKSLRQRIATLTNELDEA